MSDENTIILYHYAPQSGEYLGQSEARKDPRAGQARIPANATLIALPEEVLEETQVFVFKNEAWEVLEDHRGEVFYDENGEAFEITYLGQEISESWSTEKPPISDEEILTGIKAQAAYRIAESGHDWMAAREVGGGAAIPDSVKTYAQAVRDASDALEAMETLPQNYADDSNWPERI